MTETNTQINTSFEPSVLEKTKELVGYIIIKEATKSQQYVNSANDKNPILDFIRTLQYEYKLHTLLTPRALYELSTTIFNDEHIRDFVLGGSDELAILLSENPNDVNNLIGLIIEGLSKNRLNKQELCMIPEPILDTINLGFDVLDKMLRDNFWIVFILVLYLFTPVETYSTKL